MSSSPDPVIRAADAGHVSAARFDIDLRHEAPVPHEAVERARTAGRTAGYAEGWAQGQQAAAVAAHAARDQAEAAHHAFEARRQAALDSVLAAVGQAVARLDARIVPTLNDLQETVLASALELAEAVIGRELELAQNGGLDAIHRALAMAPPTGDVRVRLHPNDYRNLLTTDTGGEFTYEGRVIRMQPDPGLQPGDAVAECGPTTIDATIDAAMARVREVLDL
jgi:flagellar assembly protein FliH